jgi:spermidine/putrescine-binding protein
VFTTGQQQQIVYPIGQPQYGQPQTNYVQPTMVQPTVIAYNQGKVYLGHVSTITDCQFCKNQVKN